MRYQNKYEKVQVPVLHISGWYDDTQRATPMNFIAMRRRGATEAVRRNQKLVIGPWPHAINSTSKLGDIDFGPTAIIDLLGLQRRWFDRWLKAAPNGVSEEPAVRVFAMGSNQWREAPEWPLPGTAFTRYYLRSGGRANRLTGDGTLSLEGPAAEPPDRYRYDPANPTPFLTEPSFAQLGGPEDYRAVEERDDVLVYTSPPFAQQTLICGPLSAHLYAASSARDTDFMVKVLDVWPTGYAQRLNDGMVRARFRGGHEKPALIEPGRTYEYDIDAWNTCQDFLPGHRVRIEVASSAFPKFDRNPNTGDALGLTSRLMTADQTIYHDRERASYVLVPVVRQ